MKIKTLLLCLTILSVAFVNSYSQDKKAKPTKQDNKNSSVKLLNKKDTISYALGMNIAKNLQNDSILINPELLYEAFKAVANNQTPALAEEEVKFALMALQKDVMDKREAIKKVKAEAAKKNSDVFFKENKTKPGVVELASGLQYKVINPGQGNSPKKTDKVSVHYTGKLLNDQVFDSSVERGQPAEFGVGQVIPGWTEALMLMKEGAKWMLYIPGELAYGEYGTPDGRIGPNEPLIFEVELLKIIGESAIPADNE